LNATKTWHWSVRTRLEDFMATHRLLLATLVVTAAACSSGNSDGSGGSGSGGKSSASGGTTSSGGRSAAGGSSASGGSTAKGGSGSGGQTSTGGATGAGGSTATGGKTSPQSGGASGSSGGAADAGVGGSAGNGGAAAGGNTGGGGSGIDGGAGSSGAAKPSAGCGKTDGLKTLTTGGSSVAGAPTTSTRLKGVTSGGKDRLAILDVPADYDPTKPYRLIFSWRQMGGSDTGNATGLYPAPPGGPNFDAEHYAYFGLRREALTAKEPAIFIAPDTDPAGALWNYDKDSVYFDDLLKLLTDNLCIDESRVFTTGFSFGAMMSYGLSNGRASKLRAAVTMAPSQFGPSAASGPIAYMSTTGMSDDTCRWGNETSGGEGCVMTHAKANGCTIPSTFPTATKGSKKYVCYDFEGCKAGYPVKVCTFDGGHTPSSIDDGTSTGDDGLKAFIPPLAWKFISQF
jgi:hypothetical protein